MILVCERKISFTEFFFKQLKMFHTFSENYDT